ncbi:MULTISPECIES: ArsR/SmtB family transcription factor [unclassified Lentilitoribacter]|jgi:DNA-binding transcriptional ArsR family regulator|uniref:ArsR/SmtB family transcription factor n=1 Tax=unclassified Lentilitoribacter TaxID=2647570 RepID=UPI0013A6C0B6|nr:metalloregulator ArsR/SmtB family transcription factor [Lentilitoribacter sp. Alg239-R112]
MQNLSNTFSALGDKTRFAVVEQLLNEGELSVNDLQKNTTISPPAFSRHLKVLREAGVIQQRIDKQRRIYSVRPAAVQAIHRWVIDHQEFWQASVDRLEDALNSFNPEKDLK